MVDRTYRTRTLGIGAAGVPDQYADGKAAKVWEYYIGGSRNRTEQYREFMCDLLRKKGVQNICDVACGNGVDSILFLENGFKMTSFDASDKMLKYALKTRWERRKEKAFDEWVIEEANWLDLAEEHGSAKFPEGGFDAVICLGNSFAHLPDLTGDQENHKIAIRNFHQVLKPGGFLIIDHRNYDAILDSGKAPHRNVYYNSDRIIDITTSVLHVNGEPKMITLDYIVDGTDEKKIQSGSTEKDLSGHVTMRLPPLFHQFDFCFLLMRKESVKALPYIFRQEPYKVMQAAGGKSKFRLSYYPHRLEKFDQLLEGVFGKGTEHVVWGDFKPKGEIEVPAYFIHMIQKASS